MEPFENNWEFHQGSCIDMYDFYYTTMQVYVINILFLCRSLDLMLERICLEGSRRQAKYAVHALASITKDDGLMSLSVLYKV